MTIFRSLSWATTLAVASFAAPLAAQPPAAGSAPAPAVAPVPERIPAEALAELPFIRNPVLSPDGNRLAARLTAQGRNWIAVYDLGQSLTEQRPLMIEWGDYEVTWMRWAGNGRLLFGIQVTRPVPLLDMEIPVTRAGSIDLATGVTTPLIGGNGILGDDVIFVDPAGQYVLLASQQSLTDYPSVDRIDLATGRAAMVQQSRPGVWNWFADAAGVVRAGVEYDVNRVRIHYRFAAGQALRRIEPRSAAGANTIVDAIHFTPGGDRGVIVTNEATGRFAAYRFDFASETRGETVYEHPRADVGSLVVSRTGQLLGVGYEDDQRRTHWLDADLGRVQGIVDRNLPGNVNLILDRSDDASKVLIWSSAPDDPGTFFLYNRAERQLRGFATPYRQLNAHRFAQMRVVSYRSRDGLDIPAYLTLPPGRPERALPLIVMPHGGPFARDSWGFDPWVQFLASRGYAVLQPNFRGSTGYGRAHVESGYGQFGTGMIDDLEDGVRWLADQGMIDPARVCIMGASYGGYAALWAPIRHPTRYRCAISFAGISDVRTMLRYDSRISSATRYSREWRRRVEGEERTDLAAISPLRQVARLTLPLLIAHGERDRNVPPSQSRNLIRALARSGGNVESVFYPQAAHGFARAEDSVDFLRRVEAFLARHNPADAPPAAAAAAPSR
ncbi:MAG TPA: S9 family peptidase [Allosphingosinicella sp.]|nr:S9 family peptidase [Allosphingosinicella sp.]